MELHQVKEGIFLSQGQYAWDVLNKFKIKTCKASSMPLVVNLNISKSEGEKISNLIIFQSLVGKLFYLTPNKSDSMFPTSLL